MHIIVCFECAEKELWGGCWVNCGWRLWCYCLLSLFVCGSSPIKANDDEYVDRHSDVSLEHISSSPECMEICGIYIYCGAASINIIKFNQNNAGEMLINDLTRVKSVFGWMRREFEVFSRM